MKRVASILAIGLALSFGTTAYAQDPGMAQSQDMVLLRTVPSGEDVDVDGTIADISPEMILVRDDQGRMLTVLMTGATEVRTKGGFMHFGHESNASVLLRGLRVKVEGEGNQAGQLVAEEIRYSMEDLEVALAIHARAVPLETRVTAVEADAKALEGQVDELFEVSKQIRTVAEDARHEADRANAGVSATNDRIAAIDDYLLQDSATIYFTVNSAVLSPEGKASLDLLAGKIAAKEGYFIEVTGYTDVTGSDEKNQNLSQSRANAVVKYLAQSNRVPLRRIITPFGYGELYPAADNATPEGRKQNRRVEVKVLVSRGLNMQVPR
jgi:outer membrane protein OmpA-like peptidoglycan-associated protein